MSNTVSLWYSKHPLINKYLHFNSLFEKDDIFSQDEPFCYIGLISSNFNNSLLYVMKSPWPFAKLPVTFDSDRSTTNTCSASASFTVLLVDTAKLPIETSFRYSPQSSWFLVNRFAILITSKASFALSIQVSDRNKSRGRPASSTTTARPQNPYNLGKGQPFSAGNS